MIWILVGLVGLFIVGGILYFFMAYLVEKTSMIMTATFPQYFTGPDFAFLGSYWYWIPLIMALSGVIWAIIQAQRERAQGEI